MIMPNMALVRSKSEKENVAEICAAKGQLESGSQTNKYLTVSSLSRPFAAKSRPRCPN